LVAMLSVPELKAMIREIPDWPKPGVSFKDITTLLRDGEAWKFTVDRMADLCRPYRPEIVVAPEARGFIVGAALSYALGTGCVPVRKKGKLPWETIRGEYELEYGSDVLEVHKDALKPGTRVLVVDDVLATGGTIAASLDLIRRLGGQVVAAAFLIELTYLPGRQKLLNYEVVSLIQY